jgi:adenylate kinase family enzyme
VLGLGERVVAIPGARSPASARSAARAGSLVLGDDDRERLVPPRRVRRGTSRRLAGDVVVVMGIPGAGKSRTARAYVARGYVRLNRDERGGTLRALADELRALLASGAGRVVLDNAYATRASRSHVVEAALDHGARARCVWLDTPLAQAQVNMVERLLDRFGRLPAPEELETAARDEAGLMRPTSQMRVLRELEPPDADEGFAEIERIGFEREPGSGRAGVLVAAAALGSPGWRETLGALDPAAPHLVFDWRPGGAPDDLADEAEALASVVSGPVERAVCPHGGGPPVCWCRPPLPGLALVFARAHGIDLARSSLVGSSPAHRTLAATLGARLVPP